MKFVYVFIFLLFRRETEQTDIYMVIKPGKFKVCDSIIDRKRLETVVASSTSITVPRFEIQSCVSFDIDIYSSMVENTINCHSHNPRLVDSLSKIARFYNTSWDTLVRRSYDNDLLSAVAIIQKKKMHEDFDYTKYNSMTHEHLTLGAATLVNLALSSSEIHYYDNLMINKLSYFGDIDFATIRYQLINLRGWKEDDLINYDVNAGVVRYKLEHFEAFYRIKHEEKSFEYSNFEVRKFGNLDLPVLAAFKNISNNVCDGIYVLVSTNPVQQTEIAFSLLYGCKYMANSQGEDWTEYKGNSLYMLTREPLFTPVFKSLWTEFWTGLHCTGSPDYQLSTPKQFGRPSGSSPTPPSGKGPESSPAKPDKPQRPKNPNPSKGDKGSGKSGSGVKEAVKNFVAETTATALNEAGKTVANHVKNKVSEFVGGSSSEPTIEFDDKELVTVNVGLPFWNVKHQFKPERPMRTKSRNFLENFDHDRNPISRTVGNPIKWFRKGNQSGSVNPGFST